MAKRTLRATPLILLVALLLLLLAAAAAELPVGWIPSLSGEEFDLESEASRRILAAASYLNYGALMADSVPCSRRGVSYYNCHAGAQAHPYSRSCTSLAHCRG